VPTSSRKQLSSSVRAARAVPVNACVRPKRGADPPQNAVVAAFRGMLRWASSGGYGSNERPNRLVIITTGSWQTETGRLSARVKDRGHVPMSDRASLSSSSVGVGEICQAAGLQRRQAQNQERHRKSKGILSRHSPGANLTRLRVYRGYSFSRGSWLPSPFRPSGVARSIATVQGLGGLAPTAIPWSSGRAGLSTSPMGTGSSSTLALIDGPSNRPSSNCAAGSSKKIKAVLA